MTTLRSNITATQITIPVNAALQAALDASDLLDYPYLFSIDSETIRVTAGLNTNNWTARRGVSGTTAASHSSGATLTEVQGAAGGGAIAVDNLIDAPAEVTTIIAPGADVGTPGEATIRSVIVSESAPPGTAPEQFWLAPVDFSDMGFGGSIEPSYQLYVRNPEDDRWILASAGATRYDSLNDSDVRTVGSWDGPNAEWVGLRADKTGREVWLSTVSSDGSVLCRVQLTTDAGISMVWGGAVVFSVVLDDTGLKLVGLPTADPVVADALWIDTAAGRVIKVSAG